MKRRAFFAALAGAPFAVAAVASGFGVQRASGLETVATGDGGKGAAPSVNITVYGQSYSRDQIREIMALIDKSTADGVRLL